MTWDSKSKRRILQDSAKKKRRIPWDSVGFRLKKKWDSKNESWDSLRDSSRILNLIKDSTLILRLQATILVNRRHPVKIFVNPKGTPSRFQKRAFEVHFSCKAFHVLQREKCLGFFSCHWFICLLSGIPTVQKRSFQSIELSLNFRIKKKLLFFLKTTVKQR